MLPITLRWLSAGLLLLAADIAHAENGCPPGLIPASGTNINSCVPIPPGYYNNQQQAPLQSPIQPPPRWIDHWGAIAADSAKGILGTATTMISKSIAENAALADCHSKGGAACTVQLSYGNQCAVVVVGDQGYNATQGATLESAKQAGMKVCNEADSHCHVYYSDCSLPVRIQ